MKKNSNTPQQQDDSNLPLGDKNYKLLLIGFAIIILGFLLMSGGTPASPEGFNYDIFSFRRITLGPVVLVAGFIFEIYAILHREKR
ncbi:MAG: DUF3098 domain-containing protein [Rikenellaceae bacterium]